MAERKTATRISYWDTNFVLPSATLAYYKIAWSRCKFPDSMSEDGPFTQFFMREGTALDMRDPKLIIYQRDWGRPLHHQRDWWQETRHHLHTRSALEVMRDRISDPRKKLRWVETPGEREAALLHEEESSTVYVKHFMGEKDFAVFVRRPEDAFPHGHAIP